MHNDDGDNDNENNNKNSNNNKSTAIAVAAATRTTTATNITTTDELTTESNNLSSRVDLSIGETIIYVIVCFKYVFLYHI